MVAGAAYNITLSIGDGASPVESFTPLHGVQLTHMRLQHQALERSQVRGHQWAERLEEAGTATLEIAIEGIFIDSGATALLQQSAMAHIKRSIRLQLANGEVIEGAFFIPLFERYGTIGESEGYNATLINTGVISMS